MSQTSPRCGEYRRARVKVLSASVLSGSPASGHSARSVQNWLPYVNALSAHRSPRTTARDAACLILSCSANAIVAVFPSTGSLMWFSRCRSASKIHAACADRKTPNKVSATRSHVLVEVLGSIENCDRCKRGYPRLSQRTKPPSADGQHGDENSGAEKGGKK